MLVFDASVIVKLLTREPGSALALQIAQREDFRIAPDWLRIEVASALAKKVRIADLTTDAAKVALERFEWLIDESSDTMVLLDRAFTLSVEINHPLYDCIYLALAIERDCAVVTADRKFADMAIAAGYGSNIEVLR